MAVAHKTLRVAHKTLRIVFAILRKKETYKDFTVNDFTVNYEEVMVKRNAPRWIKALLKYDLMLSWLKVSKIEPEAPKKRGRPKKDSEKTLAT